MHCFPHLSHLSGRDNLPLYILVFMIACARDACGLPDSALDLILAVAVPPLDAAHFREHVRPLVVVFLMSVNLARNSLPHTTQMAGTRLFLSLKTFIKLLLKQKSIEINACRDYPIPAGYFLNVGIHRNSIHVPVNPQLKLQYH